jgi:hypothetical protein
MKIDVKVKIKLDKGKEISLGDGEARKLYEALKALYAQPVITYPMIIERIIEPERGPWRWRSPYWIADTRPNTATYCNGNVTATARIIE